MSACIKTKVPEMFLANRIIQTWNYLDWRELGQARKLKVTPRFLT